MKMYTTISVGLLMLLLGCSQRSPSPKPNSTQVVVPDSFDRAWVMSSGWCGYMGVTIALTPDKYYYWFYSDVVTGDEPEYPIAGSYTFTNGKLLLDVSEDHLYSTSWIITTNAGRTCLWAERDAGDFPRLLIPDQNFNAKAPFRNQPGLDAEQVESTVPVKAAQSASSHVR